MRRRRFSRLDLPGDFAYPAAAAVPNDEHSSGVPGGTRVGSKSGEIVRLARMEAIGDCSKRIAASIAA